MAAERSSDDVIRIRIDTGAAVRAFMAQLASQAAEGETRAPAHPANRAVFRELAPYRLVEYEYVGNGIGAIEGVFVGFPDGSLYSVADDIPEAAVDAVVAGDPERLPPILVHVVLARPQPADRVDGFLAALARHMGQTVVAVGRDDDGRMVARSHDGKSVALIGEAGNDPLPTKAQLLEWFAARSQGADGRAYARLPLDYSPHLLEFASAAERDDFVRWTRSLCDWVEACGGGWGDLGLAEMPRTAWPAPAGGPAVRLVPPGEAWQAFGRDAASPATGDGDRAQALDRARRYWAYVAATVEAGTPRDQT